MKSYFDLIPISAKVHRKQTMMTRICIVLAVFLVTVIFGFADMHLKSLREQQIQTVGNWHYYFSDINETEASLISSRPEISIAGWHKIIDSKAGYLLEENPLAISGQEESVFKDIYLGTLVEGSYPNMAGEVAISSEANKNGNIQLGDSIELTMPNEETANFVVTGFIENTSQLVSGNDIVAVLTVDGLNELEKLSSSITVKSQYIVQLSLMCEMQNVVTDIMKQLQLSEEQLIINAPLLGMLGQIDSSYVTQLYGVAIVLFFLVMLAGVLMISSSLNSNIMKRTEFFGMMRCLGATKKQVMRFVRREGLNWCKTAIPVGIGCGIVVVWILSAVMKTISPERFLYMPVFGISWISIIVGILMGIITVLLAAQSPAKKAAKVSPLEAVSGNSSSNNFIKKPVKLRFFKVETTLGINHAKNIKKNYFLMTGAFAISIILFLCFSTIVDFMNHAMAPLKPWTPDLSIVSETNSCSIMNSLANEINSNKAVKRAFGRMFAYDVPVNINGETKNSNLISYEENQFLWAEDKILYGSIKGALQDNQVLFVYNEKVKIKVGDTLSLLINNKKEKVTIAGILSDSPLARGIDTETIICSEKTFLKLTGETGYTIIDVQFRNNATDEDIIYIQSLVGDGVKYVDERASNQEARNMYLSFSFFIYSFLFIIAIITIFNIMNTVSISVSAKLKQYGAMLAIGMSEQQLIKMIIAEAATYAVSGSIVGCIIGLPLHMVIYLSMITTVWGDPWSIPFSVLGTIVVIVMVTTFLAVRGPAKYIRSMSIVETLNTQ